MPKYIEQDFKTIINIRKFIDSWFWDKYSINAYNGCQFGCVYCDTRSAKYQMPTDFENNIIIKKNIKEKLDKRLKRARKLLPDVVGLSGAIDPYQHAEEKYRNTSQCLETLEKHGYPVHICTKSTLVLRDLDLLENIGKNTWCTVSITITTANQKVSRFLETKAPTPQERFNIIKTIKRKTKYIQTGVLLIPIVPFIGDSEDGLENMVKYTKESRADYILFGSMTMRDVQAQWFLKHLKQTYPELLGHYEKLYKFQYDLKTYRGTYEVANNYIRQINKEMIRLCAAYRLNYRIKRYIPNDYRGKNYAIAEKLLNESYNLQIQNRPWTKIFWAGQNIQNLKTSVVEIANRNELRKIRNVDDKIESFILSHIDYSI